MTTSDIRHLFSHPLALALAIAYVTAVTAQQPAPPPVDRAALERQAEINKQPDTPGTGRFAALKEEVASLPRHVVYRPMDLAALGGTKLGVVAWGNGGCSDDGASSRFHLLEIASHGYLVIASGHPEWSRRAAARTTSGRAAGADPATAHATVGSVRSSRLGARGEPADRQPVLRPHRSGARGLFGLELWRPAGAAGREGPARQDAGAPQHRRAE